MNLLRNARQAIQDAPQPSTPGLIHIAAEAHDGVACLRIADNGPGLPAKAREALFQPFAGSGKPGGTGLGLAISRELARANAGDLCLVSSTDEGVVFELRLPLAVQWRPGQ